jgi:hypothetical protein
VVVEAGRAKGKVVEVKRCDQLSIGVACIATGAQHDCIAGPLKINWKVPTRTITADRVEFAYRELGTNNPGTPVVFLVHLAGVLDNWDSRRE